MLLKGGEAGCWNRSCQPRTPRTGGPSGGWGGANFLGPGVLEGDVTVTLKRFRSVFLIGLVFVLLAGGVAGTQAWFRDTETSDENTFTAGTLDLTVDGNNGTNTVKFIVDNFRPGNQRIGVWELCNIGSVNGYVDLDSIEVASYENGCWEPEDEVGDVSCGNPGEGLGELQNLVGMDLFWDYDCDGWYDAGDVRIYSSSSGPAGSVASSYDTNEPLNAGQCVCLAAQLNWWPDHYGEDNLGQSDSMVLNMMFELAQTTGQ